MRGVYLESEELLIAEAVGLALRELLITGQLPPLPAQVVAGGGRWV